MNMTSLFGIQDYASFVAAILIFQMVPGPGTIAILNATARNGVRAGAAAVLGTLCGDFVYMVAAVAGLAAILQANAFVFQALQWFGAGYLVWMGVGLLRRRMSGSIDVDVPQRSAASHFRQAFAVSLTNPKVILFFVSFFPLFLRPGAAAATLGMMMLHVTVLSLLYQGLLVVVGNRVAGALRGYPSARRLATRIAGVALIGFGIRLATGNR
ncbi:leucine efflux protein LeuE [Quisquiliibacterium transsilvanicum]|uniref:Threonine/homoserine/homoserine lactone efflux protein n=2 Tax=Quisquiliibacterium transsilvanicum TaxID=1549638 RepID=A0A7W8HLX1_9BURK|nr:threonine/homoserine/homoserine lactone efflux protein [Quisquiliibacterium transsilvanicum]